MRLGPGRAPAATVRPAVVLAAVRPVVVLLVVSVAALPAGCTRSADRPAGQRVPSCPPVAGAGLSWPAGIPADLPVPPGARLGQVRQLPSGFTLVTFTAPGTVRDSLLAVTAALQAAGYTTGRGTVGTSQARLPFTRNGKPGVLELTAVDACTTRWQLQA